MADPKTISIYDMEFSVPQPYDAGYTLSAVEAKVLNQCFAENIGNNQRKHIKNAIAEGTLEAARAAFAAYASSYIFTEAAIGGTRQSLTPLEKEARKIATAQVLKHLKKSNRKRSDVDKEAFAAEVARLAENEKVLKLAKRRLKEAEELDDLELADAA